MTSAISIHVYKYNSCEKNPGARRRFNSALFCNVRFLSYKKSPLPTGNSKNEIAQITFARSVNVSKSASFTYGSNRPLVAHLQNPGLYSNDPRIPKIKPTTLSTPAKTRYNTLESSSRLASSSSHATFSSSTDLEKVIDGIASANPQHTYPTTHSVAVWSHPDSTKYTPPKKNDKSPTFVSSSTVTLVANFGRRPKSPLEYARDRRCVLTLSLLGDIARVRGAFGVATLNGRSTRTSHRATSWRRDPRRATRRDARDDERGARLARAGSRARSRASSDGARADSSKLLFRGERFARRARLLGNHT